MFSCWDPQVIQSGTGLGTLHGAVLVGLSQELGKLAHRCHLMKLFLLASKEGGSHRQAVPWAELTDRWRVGCSMGCSQRLRTGGFLFMVQGSCLCSSCHVLKQFTPTPLGSHFANYRLSVHPLFKVSHITTSYHPTFVAKEVEKYSVYISKHPAEETNGKGENWYFQGLRLPLQGAQ